ncbi:hypothetical protein [Ensifer aridi]|uniref:hypothetical protein n=1 Tax=Ensifer aridi TaxID=1708715 RepID=UPI0011117B13|nr:hypothetical protein [Ensifer aridi]
MLSPAADRSPISISLVRQPSPQARPEVGIKSRIIILRRREDGTVFEMAARPAFLFRDPTSPMDKYKLPADYYWRGSPEHLARRHESGLE